MSARYHVEGEWTEVRAVNVRNRNAYMADHDVAPVRFAIQEADLRDTRDGHLYRNGAKRITRDGKPIRGKGGTHPYFGETAWYQADAKLDDVTWAHESS